MKTLVSVREDVAEKFKAKGIPKSLITRLIDDLMEVGFSMEDLRSFNLEATKDYDVMSELLTQNINVAVGLLNNILDNEVQDVAKAQASYHMNIGFLLGLQSTLLPCKLALLTKKTVEERAEMLDSIHDFIDSVMDQTFLE